MIKTVKTRSATWEVETLPGGAMGRLDLVECKRVPKAVTIEDGLIVRDALMGLGGTEYKGQLLNGEQEILFTIVTDRDLDTAIDVARQSRVVHALCRAGWAINQVWRVQGDEF